MEEFAEWIMDELEKMLGEDYWMEYKEMEKGNGKIYHGILIVKEAEDIGPLVYIDYYMKKYQEGSLTIPEIASAIVYQISQHPAPVSAMERIQNHYEEIKGEIRTAVCNYVANEADLVYIPHKKLLDLAVFYYIPLKGKNGWDGVLRISHKLLKNWDVSEEEMIKQAEANFRRLEDCSVISARSFVENMLIKYIGKRRYKMLKKKKPRLLDIKARIVSNKEHYWGACFLANNSVLQCLADSLQDDLIIIPLSVHEIIVQRRRDYNTVPVTTIDLEEINKEEVAKEDRLSNNIYLFCRDRKELMIYMEGDLL
ncbi:MAG TPA: hypothetical protein H9761_06055 [Candidatus Eisenbergiella merdavium]|uniref:Uncharacterized protein n=1 Tax=Candidatus Eisenbergiella merdavium TaxID=2838551 RepID=A0A9D2SQ99_9FIRM|nr:hypothetical protein [Candidatus Eisenbergiella merdavium]